MGGEFDAFLLPPKRRLRKPIAHLLEIVFRSFGSHVRGFFTVQRAAYVLLKHGGVPEMGDLVVLQLLAIASRLRLPPAHP
jgi:hypothetical protein